MEFTETKKISPITLEWRDSYPFTSITLRGQDLVQSKRSQWPSRKPLAAEARQSPNSTSEERVIGWKGNGDGEVAFFKRERSILRGHHCVLPAAPFGPSLNTGRGEREKMTLPWFLKVLRWKCFDWLALWHCRVVYLSSWHFHSFDGSFPVSIQNRANRLMNMWFKLCQRCIKSQSPQPPANFS